MLRVNNTRRPETGGYLTVYLALTISILMSLVLTLFYGARVGAVRMKTEFVTDIAMNSILAEYHRELYNQYGLLMVDTSYGTGAPSILKTQEHMRDYVRGNFETTTLGAVLSQVTLMRTYDQDAVITGYSLAADEDDGVMHRAIKGYMSGGLLESEPVVGDETESNAAALTANGFDSTDVEAMASANDSALGQVYQIDTDGDGENDDEMTADSPSSAVTATKGIGILTLAAGDIPISDAVVDETAYFSHRSPLHGTGLAGTGDTTLLDRVMFDAYIQEKCSYFGREFDKSRLKYQLEYLYAGTGSDWKNLEKVCETLLFWREASNLAHILSDSAKVEQAEALALVASILLFVPELLEVIKWSIIFAWSFAESVIDIHILLSGGKVPLVKTAETWSLSIEHLITFRDHMTEGSGQGLDYKEYLMLLLFFKDIKEKTDRLMDTMEMDIRQTEGNSGFRIDGCMDAFCAEVTVDSVSGGSHRVERIYGYG